MEPSEHDGLAVPGAVRWAIRANRIVGVSSVVGGAATAAAVALVDRAAPEQAEQLVPGELLAVGALYLVVGVALLVFAPGLRRGERTAQRVSVVLHVAASSPSIALSGNVSSVLVAVVALALLFAPTTRRWVSMTDQDRMAAALEERSIRRARRRLTEDTPSLRDIHLLPTDHDRHTAAPD